jgi:hypothetical protein
MVQGKAPFFMPQFLVPCNVFPFFRVDASAQKTGGCTARLIDTTTCTRCGQTQSLIQMEQPANLAAFQSLRTLAIGGE